MASAREDGIGGYLEFADTQSLFENSERGLDTQGKGGKYPQKGHKSSLEEHGYGPSKKKKKKKKDEKKAAVSSNNENHGLNTAAGSLELNSPPPSQEEGSVVVADLASQKKKKSKKRKMNQEEPHHKEVHTLGALTWSYELHSPPPTEEEGSLVAGENSDASQKKKKKKKRKTNQEELHPKENHDIDTSAGSLELYTMPPSQEEGSLVADAEGPEPSQKKKKSKKRKMNQEELHLEEEDYFDTQGSLAVIPPTQQSQDEQSDNVDTLQDTSPPLKKKKLTKDKKEMKSSSSAEGGKEALEFTTSVLSSGTKPVGEEHEKDKTAEKQVDGDTIKDTRPSHKKKEPQKDQKEKKSESFSSPKGVKRPLEFTGDFVSGSKPSGVERGRDVNAEKGACVVGERSPSPELFSQNQADPYEFTGSGDIAAAASTEQQTEDVPSRQHVNLPEERLQGSSEQGKTPASSKNPRQANTERGTKKRRKKKAKHRKTLGSSKKKRQAEEVPQLERSAEEEEVDEEEVASIREYQEAYRLLHNPTLSRDLYKKAEMEEFTKNTGLKIATGRFSEKERAKLKRNWTSFLKTYMLSEEFDPFCLLSTSHTPAHLKPEVAKFRRTRGFYVHIGRGIARPIKSILYCARTMFDPRKDNLMTEEEQKHLKALRKKYGDHWIRIAEILNKPPKVLQNYSKNHFEPKKKGDWTDAEKQQLIEAIKEVAGPENLEDPKKRIAWKRVAESVPTRSDKQCRTAWLHRFIKEVDVETAGEFKVRLTDQQRIKLLDMVCKFEDAKFIKWDEIWKYFPELASPQKLNNLWASRFKAKVPGYKKLTFKEVCAWLKTHYRPDLVQRINGSSVRYKKTKTKSPHLVISGRFSRQF